MSEAAETRKLKCLLVADPSLEAASHIVEQTERLAEDRLIARSGAETLDMLANNKPDMLLLSLELTSPLAADIAKKIRKSFPDVFVMATFRELSVPTMHKLEKAGISDFIPQPIDFTQLFRAASERYGVPFRRHTRYSVAMDVTRADGVVIGKTADLSEGGMQMTCFHPVHEGQSMLVDLDLGDDAGDQGRLRTRCQVLFVEGTAPQTVIARTQFQNLRGEDCRRLSNFLRSVAAKS